MNPNITADTLSRIDKLFLDRDAADLEASRIRRAKRGLEILAGEDIRGSYGLQLAMLTAVNLGVRCFAGKVIAYGSPDLWMSPCWVPMVRASTLGAAVAELGGKPGLRIGVPPRNPHLLLGDVPPERQAVRITFDGWCVGVGPAAELTRMAERPHCPLAGIAAAAVAVAEVFAEFAGISVVATRRVITLSLWRPDLTPAHPQAIGERLSELPTAVGAFGLGHLGQAYLWCLAALPYSARNTVTLLLCDYDSVQKSNIETGAVLTRSMIGMQKTRVIAKWLEERGFVTRLLERPVDENFRRTAGEPVIALSGFDDNRPRQWLAQAGFSAIFDSGLGGEAHNFDTIAFHAWPNSRDACELWPLESANELAEREARHRRQTTSNAAYKAIDADECGRLLMAGKSVAVPFVGATAACIVLAEMLKTVNGGPTFSDLKLQLCALGSSPPQTILAYEQTLPIRGCAIQTC